MRLFVRLLLVSLTRRSYDLVVQCALRLTNSGEFIRAAPWSVGDQGVRNVFHGCVHVSLAHARWLYETSMVGDSVEAVGTSRQMEAGNGLGGVWNVSCGDWAGPAGSSLAVSGALPPWWLLCLAVGLLLVGVLVAGLFLRELGPVVLAWAASL